MKRKIKFRGKNFKDEKWNYGSLAFDYDNKPMILVAGYSHTGSAFSGCHNVIPETVGQFTGFTDCVTREIYEDDILHFESYGNNYTALVKWNDEVGAWCMQLSYELRCGCRPLSEWLNEERLEVIGNIHDNPEYIK